jgi:serine/threonine protein kinase
MSNFNDFTAHGYEVMRELGANRGAGRVAYLARTIDSEQLVVIKQFQFAQTGASWDGHKAIDREVKILKQLQHPYIPRYLSSFETADSSCIVQEYIDGKPLSEIISNQQLYTPEQVKEIILKLLEVLVYLQTEFTDPVLHRDIKPANILIDSSCQPYLIDFGGAKVSEGAGGSTVSVGTLGFMPPEQRFQQFNKTTDIYSLGLSIVCWLTRTEPTEMYTLINMGTNQVMGLRESLSTYSLLFVGWIEKIVQPDPKDRYPDAEAAFNAFKPLYVKRVPEAIVSGSALEFTASKLGERMTQTLTVRNNVPDTVLEGWWEVAPHPSDPPHTPNSHAWISFGSRKFSGNVNECSIVVNTDKLMAETVYKRQILLHSNSSEENEELNLTVTTAKVPVQLDNLPWVDLLFLIVTIIPITMLSTNKSAYQGGLDIIDIIVNILSRAILCGLTTIPLIWKIIASQESKGRFFLICLAILLSIITGISGSLLFLTKAESIWLLLALLSVSFPLTLIILYPVVEHKKLVSKYRDLEEGLIRP